MVWESFQAQVKADLEREAGIRIYTQCKIDVETVFERMKCNFGVRRIHVIGKESVYNDIINIFG